MLLHHWHKEELAPDHAEVKRMHEIHLLSEAGIGLNHLWLISAHTERASSSRQNTGWDLPPESSEKVTGWGDKVMPSQAIGNAADNEMNVEGGATVDNGWDALSISQGWHYDALAENFFMKNS